MESNDFENSPFKDDGSNLQSFLFWLQHGDKNGQASFSAIQCAFNNIAGNHNLSFNVSVTDGKKQSDQHVLTSSEAKICSHRVTVLFAETLGQKQKYTDFTRIGAGIKETLFLLAKCFERRDRVILMDEPATNLHPTQIRRLMDEILSSNEHRDETGQVVVITHSPSVASLEMLSSMNKIARVDRTEYSRIVQPSRIDSDWIAENLATFHLLKPEVLFSKQIVLVEGASDKFFLNALLKHHKSSVPVDDILILDVGGISSFPKFGRFLDVFEIPLCDSSR